MLHRRPTRAGIVALLATSVLASLGGTPASAADGGVRALKPVRVNDGVAVYRLSKFRTANIRSARVRTRGKRLGLSVSRVRRAAQTGILRVRVVRVARLTGRSQRAAPRRRSRLQRLAHAVAKRSRLELVLGGSAPAKAPTSPTSSCRASFGDFRAGNWPGSCWRPYNDSSPFNRRIRENPKLNPRSDAIVRRVMGFGLPTHMVAGTAGSQDDWAHPTYYSQPNDPVFRLHCFESWGRCPIEGHEVRIPDAARAAAGGDAHLTVVDQASGWEYDLWSVRSKPRGGGTLEFGWGGRTRIDGDGLNSAGTASGYGNLAGVIRASELEAGEIRHALFRVINCSSGEKVFPATENAGAACAKAGLANGDAPPMGARCELDMSDQEIDALSVAPWRNTILRAMAR